MSVVDSLWLVPFTFVTQAFARRPYSSVAQLENTCKVRTVMPDDAQISPTIAYPPVNRD